jgi:hypothetical protein
MMAGVTHDLRMYSPAKAVRASIVQDKGRKKKRGEVLPSFYYMEVTWLTKPLVHGNDSF